MPFQTLRVSGDGGQRLVEFVRQRARHLAEDGESCHVFRFALELLRARLGVAQFAGASCDQVFDADDVDDNARQQCQHEQYVRAIAFDDPFERGSAQVGVGPGHQLLVEIMHGLVVGRHVPGDARVGRWHGQQRHRHRLGQVAVYGRCHGQRPIGVERRRGQATEAGLGLRRNDAEILDADQPLSRQLFEQTGADDGGIGVAALQGIQCAAHRHAREYQAGVAGIEVDAGFLKFARGGEIAAEGIVCRRGDTQAAQIVQFRDVGVASQRHDGGTKGVLRGRRVGQYNGGNAPDAELRCQGNILGAVGQDEIKFAPADRLAQSGPFQRPQLEVSSRYRLRQSLGQHAPT